VTARPFYFMVAFWGERYRDRFVNLCLPSLLAPGNLPLLHAEDGHRFLIATTRADWDAIGDLPIIAELRRFAPPELLIIPEGKDISYAAALHRQTRCLKLLFDAAYPNRPYGCLLLPDLIVSDGFVATLIRSAQAGHRLVLLPALRQVEEGVLAELATSRAFSPATPGRETVWPLAIAPRALAGLGLRHLHPEVLVFEEGHRHQPLYPPFRFWRVPDRNGIILHGFFGLPILMDFEAVSADHTDCLAHDDYESVYLGRNFSRCGGLHIIRDSDECGILSLTEMAINRTPPRRLNRFGSSWMPQVALLANLRKALERYTRPHRDLVRRDLFRTAVRWHADDLDETYSREEALITSIIDRAAGDYYASGYALPPRFTLNARYLPLDLVNVVQSIFRLLGGGVAVALGALTGNREDANMIWRKISALRSRFGRRPHRARRKTPS
jgi:hypothetical protein